MDGFVRHPGCHENNSGFTINQLSELIYIDILVQLEYFKKRHKTEQKYQFWQEGSHPQIIMDHKMLNQKPDYIHYNPVRCGYR